LKGQESRINPERFSALAPLIKIIMIGRTSKRCALDLQASSERPGASNGLTEAIKPSLEHLRGNARGLRNLSNYIGRRSQGGLLKVCLTPVRDS